MLQFIFQKLLNKKWMVLSLLIGNLLLIAIACANPMYSQAVMQRTLTDDLKSYLEENNRNPGAIQVKSNYASYLYMDRGIIDQAGQIYEEMIRKLNQPTVSSVLTYTQSNASISPMLKVEGADNSMHIQLTAYSDVSDHIQILHGKMFSTEIQDHVIEVVVNERTFVNQNFILDSEFEMNQLSDENGIPYRLRIVGVFENNNKQDPYWLSSPNTWSNAMLMDIDIFEDLISNPQKKNTAFTKTWYTVFDYTQIQAKDVNHILQTVREYQGKLDKLSETDLNTYFEETLEAYVPKAQKLNTTISVLQIPIFMLLAAFIFMVSGQMLEMEKNEISVFKSRGASKFQIILLYIYQSLLIAGIGFAAGIPLGMMICKLLGASDAFLEFVSRTALPVKVDSKALLFAAAAAVFSICTMVLPVFKFADLTIVAHKRQKNRGRKRIWWKMIFLDIVLLVISLYGLYQFRGQEEYLAQRVSDGAGLDPVLYACSSLFMLGAGLFLLRILPWMIRIIFEIGKKWWSPAVYTSFLRILRTNNNQGFLVVFLVLTVAMGIFSTQTARTINANAEERICYSIGADVVLQEKWGDNSQKVAEDTTGMLELTYTEPDFGKYTEMDGVDKATKVLVDNNITVSVEGGKLDHVMVMGIHTKEFGEVAWFKDGLLKSHWYEYLNAISQNANAVLVSSNFQKTYGYEVGDIINYTNHNGDSAMGIIYGFVDYWPSYSPITTIKDSDGQYKQTEQFLIVAHLSQLQSSWGITPYQIWIKTNGSSQFLYQFAEETGARFTLFNDTAAKLVALKNDPVFQGTNGILTIGFIVVLLLCATGFLIYWILSIKSRTLQFGIFRAMGMSKREVLSMLVIEQVFVSGASICGGIAVGKIDAALFVPLIQVAYSTMDRVLPLEIISTGSDYLRLGTVIGLMIVICMLVLGVLISKIKITQALKLGED